MLKDILFPLTMIDNVSVGQYLALPITLLVLLFLSQKRSILLFRTMSELKKKEEYLLEINGLKSEYEIKNRGIEDSLKYAQRIQEALLPSEEYFRGLFKDSFIFYKPKEIISGDFYWAGTRADKVFVVTADCTGHGIPGALLSMIGHEMLDKVINIDGIEKPSVILDNLSHWLEKTFNREKNPGSNILDGMDIGVCVVDRVKKNIEFAGAYFSLYILRDFRLIDLKGDKYILGTDPGSTRYTNNEISFQEDDVLYLFSDGYVDQFGGVDNKKFMPRRFRHLLLTIHEFSLDDQKAILEENLKAWKGDNEQVDDILIIGFKPV